MDTPWCKLTGVNDTDPPHNKSGVVYNITCSCGLVHIGEAKGSMETCLKEHQAACRWERVCHSKTCLDEVTNMGQYTPVCIFDQARNKTTLTIKEVLHISLAGQHTLLSRDQGTTISDCCCWGVQHVKLNMTPPPTPPFHLNSVLLPTDFRPSH